MRAPWRAVRVRHYEPTASPVARGVVAVAAIAVTVLLVVQAVDAWGSGGRLALMIGTAAVAFQLLALVPLAGHGGAGRAAPRAARRRGACSRRANRDLAVADGRAVPRPPRELTSWAVRLRSVIPETAASLGAPVRHAAAPSWPRAVWSPPGCWPRAAPSSAPSGRTALLLGLAAAVVPVGLLASRWWRSAP